MSDFNVVNLNLREKDCSSIQEDKFLEYLITIINSDKRINNLYQKIIPIIQNINQIQKKIKDLDPVFQKNDVKDFIASIKKEQDHMQLIITKLLLEILNEINYTNK